ncbi:MAG TPA: hypothetical protein VJB60_04990, partial [Candidatus Peribacterales bacterium]|nr:hypothetical protein [Candidatus Peribacterales bacterium]
MRSLWGEPLLLYRKKRDDDGGLLIGNTNTGEQGQQHPAGGVEIPPAQIALGFEKRINAIALDTLLSNFEKYQGNEDALRRYLEQNRDEITATVYEQGGHSLRTAKRVQQAITEKAMRPAEIRSLIAECIAPKPEKDEDLTKALKQNEKQEKAETPAKKKSRWKLLLAEIAKMQHPLYRAIASFLTNAAVERMDLSPDTIFQELQDRGKRLSLFRRIASTRHDLVLPQSGNAEERLRALQSLYAIFHYGEYLLDSTEQGEYFELSARVIAAMTVVEAEIAMEEQKPEEEAEAKKKETYAESEEIREFLRKEHEKKRTLTGNDGIAKRLEEKGAEKGGQNVFSILGKACEQGGWLQALRPRAEGLKYTCALITLEEIALLKHEIAFGRATEPVSLLERVKGTVLTLLQRGARGFPRERAGFIPLIEDSTEKARADFASLEKRIAATDHPLKADVEEILVLHSWLMSNEPTFDESHTVEKKIGEWRKNALSSSDDLRREATRARTNIAELLEDTSPEGAEILREANPEVLLKALADVSEERIIGENRKRLQHYEDLLPPEKSQKIYREPSLLHRKSDLEYAMKREKRVQELVEQNVSLAAVPKDSTIKALDHEYEQGRILRLAMHESFTAEQEEKILRVLEAEIHAESASLLESFSKKLKQRMEERLNVQDADVEKMATVIEEMPWEKWPEAVTEDEIATILALEKLYPPFSLRSEPDPLSAANIALQALKALTNDVRDADEIAEEEKRRREKTKNTARKIVENPKSTRVIREVLEPVANGKVNLRSTTENRINIFQSVDAQKVTASVLEKKISLQEKAPQTTREIRGVEEEFRSIEQSIEQILPSYLGASDDAFGTKVRGEIAREVGGIGVLLRSAKEREDRGSRFLIDAKWRIDSLKRLIAILEKNQKEYTELEENEFAKYVAQEETLRDKPGFVFGVYSRTEKKIVLNKTAIDHYGQSMRELTLSHERRHALHDALREVFPTFLTDVYDALHLTVPELEKRGEELMSREGLSEAAWKDEVMDELLVRHSVYEQNKEKFSDPTRLPPGLGVGRKDIELFEAMNNMDLPLNFQEGGLRSKGRILVAQSGQAAPVAPAAPVLPSGPVQRSPD